MAATPPSNLSVPPAHLDGTKTCAQSHNDSIRLIVHVYISNASNFLMTTTI